MRIGELAALAGVTTRTVRHYHRIGLLPEPARHGNGYRNYTLRDAVELTRIRKLTELGLSLDEVADVLADDAGKDLYEVLSELDADLARQEAAIWQQRVRLAELLKQAKCDDGLPVEGPVSPEVAALFTQMAQASAELPGPEPAMAAKERELFALLDGSTSASNKAWLANMQRVVGSDPASMRRVYEVYAQMGELADANVDDLRIDDVVQAILALIPEDVAGSMIDADFDMDAAESDPDGFVAAFLADFPPAQREVVRRVIRTLQERIR